MRVPRVSWAELGRVQTRGRYMFKFGWVTISEDDLAVWRNYPEATFALYEAPGQNGDFRLGSFDPEPPDRELRDFSVNNGAEPELSSDQEVAGEADED